MPLDKAKVIGSLTPDRMATQAYFNKIRLIVSSESVSSEVGLEISGTGMSTSIVSVQTWVTDKGSSDAEEPHCKDISFISSISPAAIISESVSK